MSCSACQDALRVIVEALSLGNRHEFRVALWDALAVISPELYESCGENGDHHKEALRAWLAANAEES